jgi:hypothetical protein
MMIQPMPPTPNRHPGSMARAPATGDEPTMFDELQRSLVEQRMTRRLDEAEADRLARLASGGHRSPPIRARFGRILIGLGTTIAGALDEPEPKRLT